RVARHLARVAAPTRCGCRDVRRGCVEVWPHLLAEPGNGGGVVPNRAAGSLDGLGRGLSRHPTPLIVGTSVGARIDVISINAAPVVSGLAAHAPMTSTPGSRSRPGTSIGADARRPVAPVAPPRS